MALQTPLFRAHVALGAKMVEFAGWQMPLQYRDGVLKEHQVNRQGCSLFDCSHMGEFLIEGDPVACGLDRIVTQSIVTMPLFSCRYGMALNSAGGTMDDLIVYRLGQEKWMVVVNAANITSDRQHFLANLSCGTCFKDVSAATAKLDLQGPLSREVLVRLVPEAGQLAYYTCGEFVLLGERALISRTGYTGELGFEIYYPAGKVQALWDEVLKDPRVRPTGLAVRDVLRIEMAYPLYGHELTGEISPVEAGLLSFVDWNKEFIGREALQERQRNDRSRIVHFVSASRRSPRQGHKIFSAEAELVGEVVSGTFSPALNVGIGIGFVKKEFTQIGKNIIFGEAGGRESAVVTARPFYRHGSLKS